MNIYIGRGNQYQGLFLSTIAPPAFLRVQDRLLDYARKYLVGARLGECEVDEKFQAMLFHFKTEHADNSFLFGYKERQLFFIRQSGEEVYTSWNGETNQEKNLISLLDGFEPDKGLMSGKCPTIEQYLQDETKKHGGQPLQKKKEKFIVRKIHNIEKDFEEVKKWALMEKDLLEDSVSLESEEIVFHGQKIKFHGIQSPWQKKDIVFKKIKKLKKAEEILAQRLAETREELKRVQSGEFEIEVTKEKVIQPLWLTSAKSAKPESHQYHVKDFKLRHLSGVIALDAASNDWIRSQAHKEHYWFHIENYPGSHCIVKTDDFSQFKMEDLEAIASMLRDFSKLSISEIPILYSQIKNIKGMKGVKGEVILKKPKYLRCVYRNWKEIITVL